MPEQQAYQEVRVEEEVAEPFLVLPSLLLFPKHDESSPNSF